MKSIRYLVAIDDQARFRSDVQLDLFDDHQENLALLSSYLFTVAIPSAAKISAATSVSSVDLLNQLLEAFTNNRTENRIVTIANYGHGKSHLALALANYFSKPADSEEFKLVHEKLEHAINDQARSSRFYDFKQARGEFLVVRLRGDTPSSLREQFIPSLEKALRDHTATANVQPPLWHKYAESLLTNLSEDEVCRANERLASLHLDVPTLIAQVQQRKDVRDHCIEALTAAKNMAPNLGAQLSLRETVEWVADNLCGEGKPLAGVLVMFDEFSLYVSRYAQRGAVGELQDLLNGVSTRPAKVVFLAFAQHDPLTVADNAPLSDHGRDTLKHELTRIPKKLVLYTLLESVIDAYLRQREMAWLNFTEDRDVALALDCASHIAYEAFTERYTKGLQWVPAEFDKIVTKGCFPLHPLTTALLCNLKFSTSSSMSDPRTVLGFVMQHIADKIDQMPVINNVVNWVRPIALVDYFGENISPEFYRIYQSVKRNFGYDTGDDQRSTLTALFLQEAGQITLSPDAQLEFMAESTGLSISGVTRALSALSDKNMIRYDSIKKTYSFWPANTDSAGFEWLVRSKLEKIPFNLAALEKLNGRLSSEYGYTTIPMNVTWGHPEDWAANQLILTREYIECDYLRSFTKPFAASAQGLEDGNRGGVLWLLARNEEDVRWYRENIETLIDKALSGNSTPPLIVILPKEPAFDLVEAFRRNLALQAFLQNDRSTGGTALYDHEVQQADITLKAELKRFMGDKDTYLEAIREPSRVTAPSSFRAAILELQSLTIRNILTRAYELAYRTTPREFFTQYRVATSASNKLRDAVKLVAGVLFTGQTGGLAASVRVNPVASDLVNKYLMQKWGSLSSNHVLQVPTDRRMQQAWNSLDHSFTPGSKEKSVVEPLIELLNPPHGYDFNTVTLLFAAWFGYHNHDIALKDRGLAAKHTLFAEFLQKGPRDFLQNCKIRNISLVRRNPDDARLLVRAIIDRTAEQSFAQDEAEQALVKLESFSKDTRNNL